MTSTRPRLASFILFLALVGTDRVDAQPPDRVNYQGVLRNAAGSPLSGAHEMVFRFFDGPAGGSEILRDLHCAPGAGADCDALVDGCGPGSETGGVVVTTGLYNVALGSGKVCDGGGPGSHGTLSSAFRDFGEVWIQLEIYNGSVFEVLSPRIQILSSAYALNAAHLDGRGSSSYLDTSFTGQVKAGDLSIGDLTVSGNDLDFGSGARMSTTGTSLVVRGGDSVDDDLNLISGADASSGRLLIHGQGTFEMMSGSGLFEFRNSAAAGAVRGTLDALGNLNIGGSLDVQGLGIDFGSGAGLLATATTLNLTAGDADTDILTLAAGNSLDDGGLVVLGDGDFRLVSGNGNFLFLHGASSNPAAELGPLGNLQIDGSLAVDGLGIDFGSGAGILSTATTTQLTAGDADSDILILLAGNSFDDGGLVIAGDGSFSARSGSGLFEFSNGATGAVTSALDASGNLQLDGDLDADGNDITFGVGGARVTAAPTVLTITAGDADADDLSLIAGNSLDDGRLLVNGDGTFELRSGSGLFEFVNGATAAVTAAISASGDLQLDGMLDSDLAISVGNGTVIDVAGTFPTLTIDGSAMDLNLGSGPSDGVDILGSLTVSGTKSFVQNHPEARDLSVVYVALEGDESGTYTRGSARLAEGVARVSLGETFAWVTDPDIGLTVHLTPRGAWADLYVESVSPRELVVRAAPDSPADLAFDYLVLGLRVGYEEFPVVQQRESEAKVPSQLYYENLYAAQPELRRYNALERFRVMEANGSGPAPPRELLGATALRAAIGEDDGVETRSAEADRGIDASSGGDARMSRAPRMEATGRFGDTLPRIDSSRAEVGLRRSRSTDSTTIVPVNEPVEPGDVVVLASGSIGQVALAQTAADAAVFGVVAGEPVAHFAQEGPALEAPVAVFGVVPCKVDAGFGAVRVGDLLSTSPTPGHAMAAVAPRIGTVLGKALEPLESGTGVIRVLVMLR